MTAADVISAPPASGVPAGAPDAGRPVIRALILLAALGVVLRTWVVASGWFYWDDYIFQGRAWGLPLDADYLLYGHDGHFMPGAFLLQWPITRAQPMEYWPLAAGLVVGQLVLLVLFARLALALWGRRWAAVVPVALVAVTPLTLTTGSWWAAALNGLPLQLALVVVLLALRRWAVTGRRWQVALALPVWILLLSFSEKLVVVPWACLLIAPVLMPAAHLRRSLVACVRRLWWFWGVAALVSAAYVAVYLNQVGKTPSGSAEPSQVADMVARAVLGAVLPGMLGGPLEWEPVGYGSAVGRPPAWLVVLACELVLLLVVSSSWVSRRAAWAWAWAGAYLVGDLVLVATGRLAPGVDPSIVQGLRYTADATIPLAVAVGFALVALAPVCRRALNSVSPSATAEGARGAVVVVVAAMVVLSVFSTARYREIWHANESRAWVANATQSLGAAAEGPTLVDQPVGGNVLFPLAYPWNQASWLLGPVAAQPGFGDPTTQLRIFDPDGSLVPALVDGPAALPGPTPGCGWLVQGGRDIPLAAQIIDFVHTVRVGYIASAPGSMQVALGDGPARTVDVQAGLQEVVLTLEGGGDVLRVTGLTPGVTVCSDDVRVGAPVPVQP